MKQEFDYCPYCTFYIGPPRPFRIQPEDFQASGDKMALEDIKDIPGVDFIVSKAVDLLQMPTVRLKLMGKCVKVDFENPLWMLTVNAARQLCLDKLPEIYVCSKERGASTLGSEKNPLILVSNSLVNKFTLIELQAIIAHEVAHIKAKHVQYSTLLTMIMEGFHMFLGGSLILDFLSSLLIKKWQREAELSADRGSLIVSGDPSILTSALLKLHGIYKQGDLLKYVERIRNSTWEEINETLMSHPNVLKRVKEIRSFSTSSGFKKTRLKMYKNNAFYQLFKMKHTAKNV
jgi:Zn-dependent protease with chaperone function